MRAEPLVARKDWLAALLNGAAEPPCFSEHFAKAGLVSKIHFRKPAGTSMPEPKQRANAARSRERSGVEHVFADQKHCMGLFIRSIGIARARARIGRANIARKRAPASVLGESNGRASVAKSTPARALGTPNRLERETNPVARRQNPSAEPQTLEDRSRQVSDKRKAHVGAVITFRLAATGQS